AFVTQAQQAVQEPVPETGLTQPLREPTIVAEALPGVPPPAFLGA
ncbi:hypothetical protein LCGC14_1524310, partial [marine sediment metagenome]